MRIEVEECRKLRRASACIREAEVIQVKVPRHWPKATKASVVAELVERLQKRTVREQKLLHQAEQQTRITIQTQAELETLVRRINAETFNVPLGKVQIGNAKYNHLAQVNLRTKTMTVSKYCLNNAPAQALRYLIVHELAHYFESGHGPAFWALVARYVPDHKRQSQIIKAFHQKAVIEIASRNPKGLPDGIHQGCETNQNEMTSALNKPLNSTPAATTFPASSFPTTPAIPRRKPPAPKPRKKESSPWAGFFKQLLLWD